MDGQTDRQIDKPQCGQRTAAVRGAGGAGGLGRGGCGGLQSIQHTHEALFSEPPVACEYTVQVCRKHTASAFAGS
jgi:hypothetical protein